MALRENTTAYNTGEVTIYIIIFSKWNNTSMGTIISLTIMMAKIKITVQ